MCTKFPNKYRTCHTNPCEDCKEMQRYECDQCGKTLIKPYWKIHRHLLGELFYPWLVQGLAKGITKEDIF